MRYIESSFNLRSKVKLTSLLHHLTIYLSPQSQKEEGGEREYHTYIAYNIEP